MHISEINSKNFNDIMKILVCPLCKSELKLGYDSLVCVTCSKQYPIIEGILDMRVHPKKEDTEYIERPQLQGDTDITFAGVDSNLFNIAIKLTKSPNSKILDLGCGQGTILYNLETCTKNQIIGLDISLTLSKAARNLVPNAILIVSDGLKTPFKDNVFDLICCIMVIEHVDDIRLIKEIFRILKPRCFLLLSTVIRGKGAKYFYRNEKGESVLEPTHLREYESTEELRFLLESNEFKLRKVTVFPLKFLLLYPLFRFLYKLFPSEFFRTLHTKLVTIRKFFRVYVPKYFMASILAQKTH